MTEASDSSEGASAPDDGGSDGRWDWLDLAAAHLTFDPALCAQLRTGMADAKTLLDLLPNTWHEAILAFARTRQLPVEGLLVALLHELFKQQGRCSPPAAGTGDDDIMAALAAARAIWPVPAAAVADLMTTLRDPVAAR
jgi:hypothetical protein